MTVNEQVAGLGSVSPDAVAVTEKMCWPALTLNDCPELHAIALPSRAQAKLAPGTVEENSKATLAVAFDVLTFFFGVLVRVVSGTGGGGGGPTWLYDTELAEQAEVLPATSVAVARNVVVLPAATMTGRPGEPKAAAVPVAAAGPEQLAVG